MEQNIVENIRNYCLKHEISIKEFEKKCDVANGSIGKWERGLQSPTLRTLTKIQAATGTPISTWLRKGAVHAGKKKAAGGGKD